MTGTAEEVLKDSQSIPAYQNQILRSHFRSQYYKSVTSVGPRTNDPFVTQYVDRQIGYYLTRIRSALVMLKVHCEEVQEIRANSMIDNQLQMTPEFRKKWRKALGDLSRDAKGLKNLIGSILLGLARKDAKRPRVRSWGRTGRLSPGGGVPEEGADAGGTANRRFLLPAHEHREL